LCLVQLVSIRAPLSRAGRPATPCVSSTSRSFNPRPALASGATPPRWTGSRCWTVSIRAPLSRAGRPSDCR